MNAFISGQQKLIPAVLLYAFYQDQVLMMHRNLRSGDVHQQKWNGLGGKVEKGETVLEAACREFQEEAHVHTTQNQWNWAGQLHFPEFKPAQNEDWWVTVFTATLTDEQIKKIPFAQALPHAEGTLHLIPQAQIGDLNLWEGDHFFIPHVIERIPFYGTFFYQDGRCLKHELHRVG